MVHCASFDAINSCKWFLHWFITREIKRLQWVAYDVYVFKNGGRSAPTCHKIQITEQLTWPIEAVFFPSEFNLISNFQRCIREKFEWRVTNPHFRSYLCIINWRITSWRCWFHWTHLAWDECECICRSSE